MDTQAKLFLVWTILSGSLTPVHPQTLTDALPTEGGRRPIAFASGSLERGAGGSMTLSQLNAVFDAARPTRVEVTVGPNAASMGGFRGRSGSRHPLIVPVPLKTPAVYRHTFRALSQHPEQTDRYDDLILKYSKRYGLDARLVKSIIAAESEFNPQALSPHNARGLMQVEPPTAEEMGVPRVKLSDPEHNIKAGTAYLAVLFRAAWRTFRLQGELFMDAPMWVIQRVVAAYNAGPRALAGRRGWISQTRNYVRKVILFYQSKITDVRRLPSRRSRLPQVSMTPMASFLF